MTSSDGNDIVTACCQPKCLTVSFVMTCLEQVLRSFIYTVIPCSVESSRILSSHLFLGIPFAAGHSCIHAGAHINLLIPILVTGHVESIRQPIRAARLVLRPLSQPALFSTVYRCFFYSSSSLFRKFCHLTDLRSP